MKILFIGDIVGSVGRAAIKQVLPGLKSKHRPDFIIANGENAAAGRGITRSIANELFELGIHAITMGNHTWDNKDIFEFIDSEGRLIRPANFAKEAPGKGYTVVKSGAKELAVVSLQGKTFLPPIDCPFRKADELVDMIGKKHKHIFVDFHAEATSEKIAMGWHLDGRVAAVVGTHTHVQSHDERVLPNGTAYLTDVGMVGPRDGILGMEREAVLYKFQTQMPVRFVVDEGAWMFHAVLIDLDEAAGRTKDIRLIRMSEDQYIAE